MSQRLCFTREPLVRLKLCWCSAFLSTSKDFAIYLSVPDQGLVPRMLCYCFWPYSVRSWREQMATAVWIMRVWSQAGLENELRALLIYYCFYGQGPAKVLSIPEQIEAGQPCPLLLPYTTYLLIFWIDFIQRLLWSAVPNDPLDLFPRYVPLFKESPISTGLPTLLPSLLFLLVTP